MRPILWVIALSLFAQWAYASAEAALPPVEAFIAPDAFSDIKISPDGRHLAAAVPRKDRSLLVMLSTDTMARVGALAFEEDVYLGRYEWADDSQLVYSVESRRGRRSKPQPSAHLYRVNIDGSGAEAINSSYPMVLVDPLHSQEGSVLVRFGTEGQLVLEDAEQGLARVRLENGRPTQLKARSNLVRPRHIVDNAGEIRFAVGQFAGGRHPRLDQRVGDDWVTLNDEASTGRSMRVLGFSADNNTAYLAVQEVSGPDGVYAFDLRSQERRRLLEGERVDPTDVIRAPEDGSVIALRYFDGKPKLGYVQPDHRLALELKKLERAFAGQSVWPTSYTRTGSKGVYFVSSDVNSGEYYLVDHESGKASFIAAANEALDPRLMSKMQPVRFKARDGLEIDALLTVPAGRAAGRPGPMVVMPHDGPRGVVDHWGFNRQVQMLASRGYAVLQPNFRGSADRGLEFHRQGDGEWGGKMLDDIADATRWAIAEGHASPGRICIYGFGYGAYAAMMGLARDPELYACGIGDAGPYDLAKMVSDESYGGVHRKAYLDELLKKQHIESASPTRAAASIQAPVLLGAGQYDAIVPPEHAQSLQRSLRGAGGSVELVIYDDEDHGNFLPENRIDWAKRVLATLEKHIGDTAGLRTSAEASPDHAVHLRHPAPAGAGGP